MLLSAGQTVDRYEVERHLGAGSDGDRYLVRHVRLRTLYELWVGPELSPVQAAARLDDVRARAALVHPNLVRVVDWLDVDGAPALVREHSEQPTLADRLGGTGIRVEEAHAIVRIVVLLLATGEDQGVPVGVPGPDQIYLGEGGPRIVAGAPAGSLVDLVDLLIAAAPDPGLVTLRAQASTLGPRELWDLRFGGPRVELEVHRGVPPVASTWHGPRGQSGVSATRTLPSPRRGMIGRDQPLATLLGALEGERALVTVLGTAGVGKTRLAVEAAQRYTDGPVAFVDLQSARTPEAALSAISWAIGAERDSADALAPALDGFPRLLLVLDNAEQLPPTFADTIETLRSGASTLRLLVTSRHRLGLQDEWSLPLEPLAVPATAAELDGSPAWALLQSSAPARVLRAADPERLVALLQALEGLPLAVELAAARLEVLDVDELVARLDDRFALLSDPHDPEERHGSLLAAFEASWSLLSADEQALLTDLSAFVSAFPAERVDLLSPGARPVLDRLVARSLVVRRGARFVLLVAIRAFAERKLSAPQRRALHLRHAEAHAAVAQRLRGDPSAYREGWRQMTECAPEWTAALERAATDPALVSAALASTVQLVRLALRRGPIPWAMELTQRGLALVGDPADHLAAWTDLRVLEAQILRQLGRRRDAVALLEQILARPDLAPVYQATGHAHLADAFADLNDFAASAWHSEQAVALARAHGPESIVATSSANLGDVLATRGDRDGAVARYEEALAAVPPGDRLTELEVLKRYCWARLWWDDLPGAELLLIRSRDLAAEIEDRRSLATLAGQLAMVAEAQGALARAEASYEEAVLVLTAQREHRFRSFYAGAIGRLWLRLGRYEDAVRRLEESGALDQHETWSDWLRLTYAVGLVRVGRLGEAAAVSVGEFGPALACLVEARAALDRRARAEAADALVRFDGALPPLESHLQAAIDAVVGSLRDEVDAWWVDAGGAWFQPPEGPRVNTERPAASARVLARLARERIERPGAALDALTLAEAGWPGERLVERAAANRVHVALSGLRKVGLDGLLVREGAGWLLDPGAPVLSAS